MFFRTSRVLFATLLVFAAACGGGDGSSGPSAPAATVTLAGDTLRPGDILAVTITGLDVAGGDISATLGTTPIDLVTLGDSAYAAFVPAIAAGPKTLTIPLGDTTAVFSVTVLAAVTIADPQATLDSIFDLYLAGLSAVAPEGVDSASWARETALLDSLLTDAKAELAALTADERLTLARLLTPLTQGIGSAPSLVSAAADTACAAKQMDALDAIYLGSRGVAAGLLAIPTGLFSQRLADQLMVVAKASIRRVVATEHVRNKTCKVPTKVVLSGTGVRGAPGVTGAATFAAGPDRFFKGRPMKYSFSGEFRPVSRDDLGRDPLLATVDGAYRGILGLAKGNLSKLPVWLQSEVALLPPSIAETPSGASTPGAVTAEMLQIASVSPASVSLTAGSDGESFTVTSGNTVTSDVNFTYDVYFASNPTVRKKMTGVLRPPMTATWQDIGHTFQGDRTNELIGEVVYGKLTCEGQLNLKVRGGDQGTWGDFHWVQVGPGDQENSDTTALAHANFEEGDHPFSGSWFWRSNNGSGPTYTPFTVYFRATYTDLVTNEVKETPIYSFTCN